MFVKTYDSIIKNFTTLKKDLEQLHERKAFERQLLECKIADLKGELTKVIGTLGAIKSIFPGN